MAETSNALELPMSIRKVVLHSHPQKAELDQQERICLGLLATGKTSRQMSAALSISESEVDDVLTAATEKLGGHNRLHAVSLALLSGMLDECHQ